MNSTPESRFDEWWSEDHGDSSDLEYDVDEVVEDESFDDPESF